MSSQKVMAVIIVAVILSILTTTVIVNGVYSSGGVEEYLQGIVRAILGRSLAV